MYVCDMLTGLVSVYLSASRVRGVVLVCVVPF